MACEGLEERRRMVPAIARLLFFSPEEVARVRAALDAEDSSVGGLLVDALTSPLSLLGVGGGSAAAGRGGARGAGAAAASPAPSSSGRRGLLGYFS
jgi:hypothetical protein